MDAIRNRVIRWVTFVSVMFNLGLALWLIFSLHAKPKEGSISAVPDAALTSSNSTEAAVASKDLAKVSETNSASRMPFYWREIESGDYRKYIANLRSVGCPESVIQDIINADLRQVYQGRILKIWTPKPQEYWKKQKNEQPSMVQMKQIRAVIAERQEVMKSLLGVTVRDQDTVDLMFGQVNNIDRKLAFLSEDKQGAVRAALEKMGYFEEEEKLNDKRFLGDQVDMTEHDSKKLAALKDVLTPEELKEYQMRLDARSSSLRNELQYFDPTQQEFESLYNLKKKLQEDAKNSRGYYEQKANENAAAKELLGEQRGLEYARSTDLVYIWAEKAVELYGLPEDSAVQAWSVKQQTMAEADRIRKNTGLSAEALQSQLETLQRSATDQLTSLLGTQGSRLVRQGDGMWLIHLTHK